ncbi:hypothetical protein JCM8097_002003 [Rhodosporidiobolus ruineniae]
MSTSTRGRSKGKARATSIAETAVSSTPSAADSLSPPEVVAPTYVPAPGALKSRAPGRKDVACRGCRKRKIRCDASKPSCMSCQYIYKEPCIYDHKPTAADAKALQDENARLRSLLDSLVGAEAKERERLLADYSASTSSTTPESSTSTRTTKRNLSEAEDPSEADPRSHSPEDAMAAAMLSELSVAASGQVEHYGVTSFLHRPSLGAQPSPPVHLDSPGSSTTSRLRTRDVPADLRNHLLHLFFVWQTVHCHVYKPALMRDIEGGPFVNDFLLNVIFAHAARFSDRSAVKSSSSDINTAGGVFLARAKEFLQAELDKPSSIPTAQGLLILGGRECACGNHSQGFLYTAMGLSMAIDLGVHVDGLKVAGDGDDPLTVEVRRRLFWSCYCWDKSISLCLGRSPRFLKGDRSFFNLPANFNKTNDDLPWLPELADQPETLQHYPVFPFRDGAYFEKFCQLAEVIEDILLELYASKRRTGLDQQTLERFNADLELWLSRLDADFLIPPDATVSPPPNRITLSMLYHATTILVNRPFAFDGWGPRISVQEQVREGAKQRCRSAANEIVSLLELYDATFRFRNMNWLMSYTAYTAATISTIDLQASTPGVASQASRRVETILSALTSSSTISPGVQRSIELIRHLMANAPPASGAATPRGGATYKRARVGELGSGGSSDALAALQDPSQWHLPLDPLSTVEHDSTAALLLPDPSLQPDSLLLPEFPEVGPLAWPGGVSYDFDWLAIDWLQGGEPGQLQ